MCGLCRRILIVLYTQKKFVNIFGLCWHTRHTRMMSFRKEAPQVPSKIEAYTAMAAQTAAKITADFTSWTAFLSLTARLYKYKFCEQLLIFAQRPTATACAEYSVWTQNINVSAHPARALFLLDLPQRLRWGPE